MEVRRAGNLGGAGDFPRTKPASERSELAEAKQTSAEALIPGFSVDRVTWPSAVIRLGLVAAAALEAIAQRLAESTAERFGVGFVGAAPQQGTTTLALALARHLVLQGQKVVLVDAALDRPGLCQRLGVLPEVGWDALLTQDIPLTEVMIQSEEQPLILVPWIQGPEAAPRESAISSHRRVSSGNRPAELRPFLVNFLRGLAAQGGALLLDLGALPPDSRTRDDLRWQLVPLLAGIITVWDARHPFGGERERLESELVAAGGILLGGADNFVSLRKCA
jgi:hypothetical protein